MAKTFTKQTRSRSSISTCNSAWLRTHWWKYRTRWWMGWTWWLDGRRRRVGRIINSFELTWSVIIHGSFGRLLRTSSENLLCGMSCSMSRTSFSVSLSPSGPSDLTKCPLGYLECRGHWSIATMTRWLYKFSAWRVSILIRGIFLSAGMKMCRADPLRIFGWIIPQYWRHFLLMIPTTFPVGCFSFLLTFSCKIFSVSSCSSVVSSTVLSSNTISLGAVHCSSGSNSTATMSPSIERLRDSRPWMRI